MKIVAISDMHGYLKDIPECELLIIAGDISPLRIQSNTAKMLEWLEDDFMPWLESQLCRKVVLVAGNHDFIFEADGTDLNPKIGEKNKCSELIWVNIESLPIETTSKVKKIIDNILKDKFYDKL